jgi:hypothetical protein
MSNASPQDNLTPEEIESLDRLEAVARAGLDTHVAVGNAFAEIRDRRLYRGASATFEEYLRARWGVDVAGGQAESKAIVVTGEAPGPAAPAAPAAPVISAGRAQPCEALAKVCEQTLAALGGDMEVLVDIEFAIRRQPDGAGSTGGSARSIARVVDQDLLPRLRWLLAQASGTVANVTQQLEAHAADLDDAAYEDLRNDVLLLDEDLRALKGLMAGLVDWDSELTRLLEDEVPPLDADGDGDGPAGED